MRIQYKNYILEQEENRFNLLIKGTGIKKGTTETFEKLDTIGYGFTLDAAIQRLILEELSKQEKTVFLGVFLKEYKKEKAELLGEIKL